jgi:hypothetical protein
MEQQEQLTEFKIQLALPAPNIEVAQEVANKAQVLINQFGYYQSCRRIQVQYHSV